MNDIIVPDLSGYNEKQFQRTVEEIAGYCGFGTAYHTKFSIGSDPGYPDLSLFNPRDGGAVFLECKVKKNTPTARQRMWLYDLRCAGFHAYVAHPDWIETIVSVLRGEYLPPKVGSGKVHPDLRDICFPPDFVTEV